MGVGDGYNIFDVESSSVIWHTAQPNMWQLHIKATIILKLNGIRGNLVIRPKKYMFPLFHYAEFCSLFPLFVQVIPNFCSGSIVSSLLMAILFLFSRKLKLRWKEKISS